MPGFRRDKLKPWDCWQNNARSLGLLRVGAVNNPRLLGLSLEYRQKLGLAGELGWDKPRLLGLSLEYRQKLGFIGRLEWNKPGIPGLYSE